MKKYVFDFANGVRCCDDGNNPKAKHYETGDKISEADLKDWTPISLDEVFNDLGLGDENEEDE